MEILGELLLVGFLSISIYVLYLLTDSLNLFGRESPTPSVIFVIPLGLFWTIIFAGLFNIQPRGWWFIPIVLTSIIGTILTSVTERGKRFEQRIRSDGVKHRLETELGIIAFMLESVLLSIILLAPILFLTFLYAGTSALSGLLSSIGLIQFADWLTESRETLFVAGRVLLGLGLVISFLMGSFTTRHIAESKLFTNDTRPIDGVVLGVYHALAPGVESIFSLFLLAVTIILLVYVGQGQSAMFSMVSITSLIWSSMALIFLFMIIHAIFIGRFLGGYRTIIQVQQGETTR